MPLNRAYIGRTWKSDDIYEVSREKLRDYALATVEPHPACLDPAVSTELGHPGVAAPPTFATALWARMNTWPVREPDIGRSSELNMVIGDQHVIHHRPIWPGDHLMFSTTVKDIRDVGGKHELMEMEHQVTSVSGEPVCTIVEMVISRGTATRRAG
jgi:acyl dehydratase